MSGVVEFSRGNAPDPLAYTPARAALLDRLDMAVSQVDAPDPLAYTPARAALLDRLDMAVSQVKAPDPLAYTPARAALLDRLDMAVSQVGFPWDRARISFARLVTASPALQTVVSVTGRGFVQLGVTTDISVGALQARVVLTVDGVVISDISDSSLASGMNNGYRAYGAGNILHVEAPNHFIGPYGVVRRPAVNLENPAADAGRLGFRTSFLMQISTTSAQNIIGFAVVTTV